MAHIHSDRTPVVVPTTVTTAATLTGHSDHLLPAAPALQPLLPDGGLRRGTTIGVAGTGATSLGFALLAEVTAAGAWCAAVGLGSLGLLAAEHAGVTLSRFVLVPDPGADWPVIVAALLDAFEVVLLRPPTRIGGPLRRRVTGRVRERQRVLIVTDDAAGLASDITLTGTNGVWEGLGWGAGHLRARQLRVRSEGRRLPGRPRHTTVWLPDARGRLTPARPVPVPSGLRVEGVA